MDDLELVIGFTDDNKFKIGFYGGYKLFNCSSTGYYGRKNHFILTKDLDEIDSSICTTVLRISRQEGAYMLTLPQDALLRDTPRSLLLRFRRNA